MAINAISFRGTELETQKLEKTTTKAKVDLKQEEDKVELSTKKQKPVRNFWGSVGAYFAASFVNAGALLAGFPILNGMRKQNNFNEDDLKTVHNAIKQMNVESGLKDKGVRVRFLNSFKMNLKKEKFNPEDYVKNYFEKIDRNRFDKKAINPVRQGGNAFFIGKDAKSTTLTLSECEKIFKEEGFKALREKIKATTKIYVKANSVILPEKALAGAGFHELGHAMNFNLSKIGKFLQKCRPVAILAAPLLTMYAVFTRASKPKEEGKELNGAQKTHNFVRNNAGKLAFVASLPMLIEEGMASIKGQKYANKLLKPELAKRVLKGNAIAYMSYLATAVFGALAAATAVKVKDNAIAKKEGRIARREALDKLAEQQKEEEIKSLKSLDTYRSNSDGKAGGVELDKGVLDEIKNEQGDVGTYRS